MNNLKKITYIVFMLHLLLICTSVGYSEQISKAVRYRADFSPLGSGFSKEYLVPSFAITDDWPLYLRFNFQLNPGQVIAELNGEIILDPDNRTITIRGTDGEFLTNGGIIFTGKLVGDFEILGWYVYHEWDIPGFPQINQSWDDSDEFQSFLLDETKPAEVEAKLRALVTVTISAIDIAKLIIDGLTAGGTKVVPKAVIDKIKDWLDAGIKINGGLSSELALYGKAISVNGEYIRREGQSISAPGLDLSRNSYKVNSEYLEHLTFNLNALISADLYAVLDPPLLGPIWSTSVELVEVPIPLLPDRQGDFDFETTPNPIVFPIDATPANQAPQTVSSINVHPLTVRGSAATVDVSPYFSDPDNDRLTYSAQSSNTSVARVSESGSRITITPGDEGRAQVTVTASDGTSTARQSFSVDVQDAAHTACSFDLSQSSQDVLAAGGSLQVGVTTTSGCNWRATTSSNFLSVSPSRGTGSGTVTVRVDENTSTRSRNGTAQIAGQTFRVNQDGKRTIASQTLSRGDAVIVQNTLGIGLNVRSGAGIDNPWIGKVFDGATGEIQNGPRSADGYKWYQVEWDHGVTGWSVEAIDEDLLLLRRPADLAIESFDVSDHTLDPGEEFTLSLTVENIGYNRSATTDLYYYHTSTAPLTSTDDLTLVGTDSVSGLNPDRSSNESIRVKAPLTPGTYYYAATLINNGDDPNIVNNFVPSKERVTVNDITYPDLVVESFSVSEDILAPGERFKLSATVRNEGTGGSRSTTLRYYRSSNSTISTDGTQVETDGVNSLDPDETDDEDDYVTAPHEAGVYYYGACVDSVRDESNTNNNCSDGVRVTVRSPDLVVENVSVSTNTVTIGESFTLSVTVRNQGSGPADNTTLRYYRSSDSTISRNDTQVEADSVRSLSAGSTSNESETIRPSNAGTYYYGVCVDSVTGESNRNNNCSTGSLVTVRVLNQAPLAVDDTAEVDAGSTVSIDVLEDDTDAEDNSLTVALVSQPINGTATVNTDKTISYTHDGSPTPRDSFTYKVNDGTTDSNIATVTMTVMLVPEAISITDANLRGAVETALDKASGATITDVEMMTLTSLSASNQNINTLTGLEFATNLIRLDLSYAYVGDQFVNSNSVSDLSPLADLTTLRSLNLSGNDISHVSTLTGLTNLTELVLSNNSVSDLSPLAGLTNLRLLSLFNNSVSDLAPLVANTGLGDGDRVDVDRNPLNDNSVNTIIPTLKSRGVDVNFEVNTIPEPNSVQTLVKISGDNQQGVPNAVLASPFIVEARDAANSGVQGINVTFAVTAGGGTLSETTVMTGTNGRAQTTLTLGSQPGANTVRASVAGIAQTVTFNAVAGTGVNIPDPNLRTKIETALSKQAGDTITPADMATLTGFYVHSGLISDLTGLEFATNLTSLMLGGASIRVSDLSPLAGLTKLTKLILVGKSISNLSPLAGLTNLTELELWYIGFGSVSDISPLAELTNLKSLYFRYARISDFSPLGRLTNLKSLTVTYCSLSNISSMGGFTHLTSLNLYGNSIRDISPLAGLTNLTSLNLSDNPISRLSPLAELTNLTELSLGYSTSISDPSPLVGLTNLTSLFLIRTSISDFSFLAGLTDLTSLALSENSISDLSPVAGLTHLTSLGLDRNSISDISPLTGLTHLTRLGLSNNSISDISPLVANTGLGSGDEVDVQSNPLSYQSIHTHIPALVSRGVGVSFTNQAHPALLKISGDAQGGTPGATLANPFVVEAQDANGSALAAVAVTFTVTAGGGTLSTTTTTTDAKGRAESTLTLGNIPGINTVTVSATGIPVGVTFNTEEGIGVNIPDPNLRAKIETALNKQSGVPITVVDMATLTSLGASSSNISDLTGIEHATNLTELQLWDNTISDISALSGLTNLTHLYLSNNAISDISPVVGLTNLTWLGFGSTPISDISAVAGLTHLTGLDLYYNSISDLSPVAGLTNLTYLSLQGNSVSDISAVAGLTHLTNLILSENSISDISPLVANTGLGSGDKVYVAGNPLSYPSIHTHIPTLQSKGVTVEFDTRTSTTLEIVSGNNQQGVPDTALANSFVVEVKDQHSEVFEGVPVTFTVTSGGGTLSDTSTTTHANGRAESTLTLGSNPGTNTVSVSATGIPATVTFSTVAGINVNIPDTNLRAKIETALNKQAGDPITATEMATLTSVDASNTNISNLTGIEHATNLTSLSLYNNSLSDLSPLAGLTKLTDLVIYGNSLSDLSPLAGLTNLTSLKLGRNSLSDLSPVARLTKLTYLGLFNNSISDLAPLVVNTGLGSGDTVRVTSNPLSYPSIHTHIPILQSRGVTVQFDTRTPTTLEIVSGDNQQGAPGVALANPFVVEVKDQHSEAFEGVPVTFTVTAGGGTLRAQTAITDADGRAETTLTLASKPGPNTVSVSVEGISDPVTFNTGTGVNIPDPNLRAKIETALNKKAGTPITAAEMATLTGSLDAINANISDLTGLEHATHLTSLNLQSNSVSPIAGLTNLDLRSNSLWRWINQSHSVGS